MPDFTGLEGPDDPRHIALFVQNLEGKLTSVLYNNTSHIPIYYGAGIYSSELPGEVRKSIRKITGNNIPVLFLNGAQGDVTLGDLLNPVQETKEEKMKRVTDMVVKETMRLYKNAKFDDDPVLMHDYYDLKVGVRLPSVEQLVDGHRVLDSIDAGANIRGMPMIMAFGAVYLQEKYGDNPFHKITRYYSIPGLKNIF